MTLAMKLLEGVELDPGQLAELRAITSLYYTKLAGVSSVPNASSSALDELVLDRVHEMLHGEQRSLFDRKRAAVRPADEHGGARIGLDF